MITWQLLKQELDVWTPVWDTNINPTKPDYFGIVKTSEGLEIACAGTAFAGQLAKNVAPMLTAATTLRASYQVKFGASLLSNGHVLELDRKFTDADGWTYDGSFQIVTDGGWVTQVSADGGGWHNQSAQQLQPDVWNVINVDYSVNYLKRCIYVNGGTGLPAKQLGWTPSQVVTQLQLCTNGNTGFYTATFSAITLEALA